MKKILTCLLTMLGLTTACGQENFENTNVEGFAALTKQADVVILDVRTAEEYAEGHIEGAILIDQKKDDFESLAKQQLTKDKHIAVYCRSGRRSANAAGRLAAMGYKCTNLKGGIMAWQEAKMPITKDTYEVDTFKTKSGKTVKMYALVHASIRIVYDGKEFEKYPFWIAHYYVKELEYEGEWSFWQHTDVGEVDGINGYVDVDVFNGSSSEFEDLLLPDR